MLTTTAPEVQTTYHRDPFGPFYEVRVGAHLFFVARNGAQWGVDGRDREGIDPAAYLEAEDIATRARRARRAGGTFRDEPFKTKRAVIEALVSAVVAHEADKAAQLAFRAERDAERAQLREGRRALDDVTDLEAERDLVAAYTGDGRGRDGWATAWSALVARGWAVPCDPERADHGWRLTDAGYDRVDALPRWRFAAHHAEVLAALVTRLPSRPAAHARDRLRRAARDAGFAWSDPSGAR